LWTLDQSLEKQTSLRSGLVLKSIEDYLLGKQYPLEQFHHCNNESQMAEMCYTRLPQI